MNAWNKIEKSNLFLLNGEKIDLCETIQELVGEIKSDEEWVYWGENSFCDCPSFIIGAYWALTEWHGGQCSPEYAAMCAIGSVFSPGMTSRPEPDSCETDAYNAVNEYFKTLNERVKQ